MNNTEIKPQRFTLRLEINAKDKKEADNVGNSLVLILNKLTPEQVIKLGNVAKDEKKLKQALLFL